jgi:hypothetical protein
MGKGRPTLYFTEDEKPQQIKITREAFDKLTEYCKRIHGIKTQVASAAVIEFVDKQNNN